jgi:AraC-like DNA-binding protein
MNDYPAVPLLDHRPYDRIREFYLYQEPALLAAMRRGDRGEAMRIINHVLVHIYSAGEERSDLLKGLLLELVVMISRAAIEAGAMQHEVLGTNFRILTELAEIEDDEQLAAWLRKAFDHLFSTIQRQLDFTPPLLIGKALDFMRANLHRDITRDETAQHAGISPSHFSHLLKERTGRSFTELLRQCRVDLACEMLQHRRTARHHRRPLRILRSKLLHPGLPRCERCHTRSVPRAGAGRLPAMPRRRFFEAQPDPARRLRRR